MDKKFIVGFIAVFIVSLVLGFINHGLTLHDEYQATGLFRPDSEAERYTLWMLLAHLSLSFAFVWIYRRGREERPWLGQGLRFGVMIALLMVVPIYLIYYAVQPMPGLLVFRQISYDTVATLIMGALVAFVYR